MGWEGLIFANCSCEEYGGGEAEDEILVVMLAIVVILKGVNAYLMGDVSPGVGSVLCCALLERRGHHFCCDTEQLRVGCWVDLDEHLVELQVALQEGQIDSR
jgi:hypothetical protein